jgi:hypothetical protein
MPARVFFACGSDQFTSEDFDGSWEQARRILAAFGWPDVEHPIDNRPELAAWAFSEASKARARLDSGAWILQTYPFSPLVLSAPAASTPGPSD